MSAQLLLTLIVLLMLCTGIIIGALVGSGYAEDQLAERSRELNAREAELDAQWQALEKTQRLNQNFWQARQLMREEALRHNQHPDNPSGWSQAE
jgi:predicted acylesterase/phospholipase RssA